MIRTLLKAVAYSKAPRATFAVLHPAGAVRLKKFAWDMRHAPAPRVSALGAAALALPVGLLLGRLGRGRPNTTEATTEAHPRPERAAAPGQDYTGGI